MPSIITHDIFAKQVLNSLTKKDQNLVKKAEQIYYTFAQSHDYLFYYFSLNLRNAKKIKNIGKKGHKQKTQLYFFNMINNIKKNNLENNPQAVAYLYGSLTHYVLDTTCHPFIFYKTGTYNKDNPETNKYHGQHTHMEKDIDSYYYEKKYKRAYKYCNVNKEIIQKPLFSEELISLINDTYYDTYKEQNIGNYYKKSIKKAKIIYSLFINDRHGIKRFFYKIIDKITNHKFGYISSYSTHIDNFNINFLNLDHKNWNHPSLKNKIYNYSFDDLLDISLKKCLNIIKHVNKVLYEDYDISSLDKVIPNISYTTGLPLENNKNMRYFEY